MGHDAHRALDIGRSDGSGHRARVDVFKTQVVDTGGGGVPRLAGFEHAPADRAP